MNQAANQAYAGDVDPTEAWETLSTQSDARLIDVRTRPEWTFVGIVDTQTLPEALHQDWQVWPDMAIATDFPEKLAARLRESGASASSPLFFLCRSGVRSAAAAAAMTRAGYDKCYNIAGGFEGDPDSHRHRGKVNGWKAANLPWRQG